MNSKIVKAAPIEIDWHQGLSIYASEAFLKTISNEYGWIGGMDKHGNVLCVLPYSLIRRSIFRLVRFPVETILIQPDLTIDEERVFLNCAMQYFRSIRADLVMPATFNTVFRTFPEGACAAPFGSYVLSLAQSEENLWDNVHSKHRNSIRSAQKRGVTIHTGFEHLPTAYRLTRASFIRSARGTLGKARQYLRNDFEGFKRQVTSLEGNAVVFVAKLGDETQGAAVMHFSEHSAYYMHGGSIDKTVPGAQNLLQWEAILYFKRLGVQYYDFVGARISPEKGSKIEGIMNFKKRFGGTLVQGYMWKYPFHDFRYSLYNLAARLRSSGDVVDQERHKLTDNMSVA